MRLNLKLARIKYGLNQSELAKKIGVSQQTICKWENGFSSPKRMTHVKNLERLLHESKEVLFQDVFGDDC